MGLKYVNRAKKKQLEQTMGIRVFVEKNCKNYFEYKN